MDMLCIWCFQYKPITEESFRDHMWHAGLHLICAAIVISSFIMKIGNVMIEEMLFRI